MSAIIGGCDLLQEAGAQISASSELAGQGIGAVLTDLIGETWRSGSEVTRVIRLVLAGQRDLAALVLATPADEMLCEAHSRIRLTCSAVAPDGTDVLDTGEVCAAMPAGRWVWPIGAAVEPNRIWNPCLTDAADGWAAGGAASGSSTAGRSVTAAHGRRRCSGSGSETWRGGAWRQAACSASRP